MIITTVEEAEKAIIVEVSGAINFPQVEELFGQYHHLRHSTSGFREIVDLLNANEITLSYNGVLQLSYQFSRLSPKEGLRETVFYTRTDLQYGISRMAQSVFEGINYPIVVKRLYN